MTHTDLVVRIYCNPFFPTWQSMKSILQKRSYHVNDACSLCTHIWTTNYRPFCWFLNPIPHPVLFSHFLTVLTHLGSLGFRSEKLQICSIRSCLFCVCFGDFICRIIWHIVLVLHIACFPFNYKLIHDFEGSFLLSFQLSISMPIDQCTYRRFYCTHPLYWQPH